MKLSNYLRILLKKCWACAHNFIFSLRTPNKYNSPKF